MLVQVVVVLIALVALVNLGIGALPFLLPLLMQIGFGLSPFKSGLVTFADRKSVV